MCYIEWTKVIDILPTIVIPLVVAWIAWLTFRVNQNKLKLDLYNRRFNVYESTLNYYYAKVYGAEQEVQEAAQIFIKHAREARFLFGKDSDVFKILSEFKQQMAIFLNPNAMNKDVDPEKLLLKLEEALEPWLDFRSIPKNKPTKE